MTSGTYGGRSLTPGSGCWTGYPFIELGDAPGKRAPIRQVRLVSFDNNKYCRVVVDGVTAEVKAGYLFPTRAECEAFEEGR